MAGPEYRRAQGDAALPQGRWRAGHKTSLPRGVSDWGVVRSATGRYSSAIQCLKAATRWAWESDLMARDVLAGYKRPKIEPSDRVSSAWSAEEAGRFLSSVADDRLRAAWWLLFLPAASGEVRCAGSGGRTLT